MSYLQQIWSTKAHMCTAFILSDIPTNSRCIKDINLILNTNLNRVKWPRHGVWWLFVAKLPYLAGVRTATLVVVSDSVNEQ